MYSNQPNPNRVDVYKPTDDEWYGNDILCYRHGDYIPVHRTSRIVTVSFMQLSDGKYRVCVWGNDDFGLEKDYNLEDEAWYNFIKVIKMHAVNKQPLKDMGFYNA